MEDVRQENWKNSRRNAMETSALIYRYLSEKFSCANVFHTSPPERVDADIISKAVLKSVEKSALNRTLPLGLLTK